MTPHRERIHSYLTSLRSVLEELSIEDIEKIVSVIEEAYERDATLYICGNGGSASTAAHWVCDFAKGTIASGVRRLRMMSFSDSLSTLTAYANDVSYDQVFAEPVRTYTRRGDVVILLTASGNSPNILEAAKAAKEMGAITIGLIGFGGGKLAALVDHSIVVKNREYGPVEDLHMILDHIISLCLRDMLAQNSK